MINQSVHNFVENNQLQFSSCCTNMFCECAKMYMANKIKILIFKISKYRYHPKTKYRILWFLHLYIELMARVVILV